MEIQMVVKDRSRIAQAGLARPIQNERDYREAKALLGRTMRAARSTEAALRAEALLREVVDYEIRVDAADDEAGHPGLGLDDYEGPPRRWVDPVGD